MTTALAPLTPEQQLIADWRAHMAHDKGYGSIHASEIDRDEYERELAAINSTKEVESATE